jgi:hypothetical protein
VLNFAFKERWEPFFLSSFAIFLYLHGWRRPKNTQKFMRIKSNFNNNKKWKIKLRNETKRKKEHHRGKKDSQK